MNTRILTPLQSAMKTATNRQIAGSGGVEMSSRVTRVGTGAISQYQNPEKPDWMIPVDVAVQLMIDSRQYHVIEAMALQLGGYFVRPLGGNPYTAYTQAMEKISREFGKLINDTGKALSDGKFTDAERGKLEKDLEILLSATLTALNAIKERKDESGSAAR